MPFLKETANGSDEVHYMHLIVKHAGIEIIWLNYANKAYFGCRRNRGI